MTSFRVSFKGNSFEMSQFPYQSLKKINSAFDKTGLLLQIALESEQRLKAFYQLFSWTSDGFSKCLIDKMIGLQGYLTI